MRPTPMFLICCCKRFEKSRAAVWRSVAAVHEAVDANVVHTFALRHFEQRVEVGIHRMDAAVAQQSHEVKAAGFGVVHRHEENRVAEEISGCDHFVDAHHVHQQDSAGADVEVADFAIAHLAFGQPDERTGGMNQGIRKFS